MGIKKKNKKDDSNRNPGVGVIVQKADSGMVCKKKAMLVLVFYLQLFLFDGIKTGNPD